MPLSLSWSLGFLAVVGAVAGVGVMGRLVVELVLYSSLALMQMVRRLRLRCFELTRWDAWLGQQAKLCGSKYVLPAVVVLAVLENASLLVDAGDFAAQLAVDVASEPMELSPVQFVLCFGAFYFAFTMVAGFKAKRRAQQQQQQHKEKVDAQPQQQQPASALAYSLDTAASLRQHYHSNCGGGSKAAATVVGDENVYYQNKRGGGNAAHTPQLHGARTPQRTRPFVAAGAASAPRYPASSSKSYNSL